MKKYAFGVDIGGTTCKIGFFDTNGTLLDKWEIKTNTENNGESILSDVAKAVDNKLAGFNGAGGEIGHITVNHDEIEACNCGQYGCLEQYTSATGIVRLAKRKLAKSSEETSIREIPNLTAKDVFDAAKAGDTIAIGLVDEVCEILGSTLSNIACVVNPEIIVIGGGVSKAGDILLDNIKKHFVETAFMACRDTKFALAGLGNDAGMYGCVEMLLD